MKKTNILVALAIAEVLAGALPLVASIVALAVLLDPELALWASTVQTQQELLVVVVVVAPVVVVVVVALLVALLVVAPVVVALALTALAVRSSAATARS